MSFEDKSIDALIRVAKAGLGFTLVANSKTAEDIHQLTNAAAASGAKITFIYRPTPDQSPGKPS